MNEKEETEFRFSSHQKNNILSGLKNIDRELSVVAAAFRGIHTKEAEDLAAAFNAIEIAVARAKSAARGLK